jgi:signal transduction histidine kinase
MATVQKNMCVSAQGEAKKEAPVALVPGEELANPADLLQAYSELRGRFQRTTNALGIRGPRFENSAGHLNGYVELLQSEKLGSLNARQREVLQDMQSSGKRLQTFIQDFLTYSALETGG